jgi:hypothetical protein
MSAPVPLAQSCCGFASLRSGVRWVDQNSLCCILLSRIYVELASAQHTTSLIHTLYSLLAAFDILVAFCTIILALSFILFPSGKGTGLSHFLLYNEQVSRHVASALSFKPCIMSSQPTGDLGHNDHGCGLWLLNFLWHNGSYPPNVLNSAFPNFDAFFSAPGIARYSRARPQEAVVLLPLEVGTLLF